VESSRGDGVSRKRELTIRPPMADRGALLHARRDTRWPFYRQVSKGGLRTSSPRACRDMGSAIAACAGRRTTTMRLAGRLWSARRRARVAREERGNSGG
jgi:hypothetical protein